VSGTDGASAKQGVRLHPAAMALVGLSLLSAVAFVLWATPGRVNDWMVVGVTGLAALLGGLLLAAIVHLITGRSHAAFNAVIGIVALGFISFLGWQVYRRWNASPSVRSAPAAATAAPAAAPDVASVPEMTREERRAFLTQVFTQIGARINEKAAAHAAAKSAFEDAGSVLPHTFSTFEDVTGRAALLSTYNDSTQQFLDTITEAPAQLRRQLTQRGLRPAVVDESVKGIARKFQLETYSKVMTARLKTNQAMARYFELVRKHWGTHKVEGNRFVLEDAAADEELLNIMREIMDGARGEVAANAAEDEEPATGPDAKVDPK
jgi:hypothetical protein